MQAIDRSTVPTESRKRRVLALVATAAVALGTFALPPAIASAAPSVPHEEVLIGGFEDAGEGWNLWPGGGTTGSWETTTESPAQGETAAALTVNTDGASGAATFSRNTPTGLDPLGLTFALRTENIDEIAVQLVDSTGQVFQQRFPIESTTDWQQFELTDRTGGINPQHWGGNNDGVWRGDLKEVAFAVSFYQFVDRAAPASVDVDAVTVQSKMSDLAVRPTTIGNVFTTEQEVTVGFVSAADAVTWEVYDINEVLVASGSGATADLDGRIPLELPGTGWFDVRLSAERGGETVATATTTVALVTPFDIAASSDGRIGTATHYGQRWNPATIPLLPLGGYQSARDEAYWNDQEKTAGTIEWTDKVERFTGALDANDVDFFLVLSYGNSVWGGTPDDAASIEAFANYALESVRKFGTDGTVFEVWNEWNIGSGAVPLALQKSEFYVALLKEVYQTVKAEFPDAVIAGPVAAGYPAAWMKGFVDAGGLDYIDALTFHPYSYPNDAAPLQQDLDNAKALMASVDKERPIIISELGWPTGTTGRSSTERVQADYLVQSVALALAEGVQNYTVYSFIDEGMDESDVEDKFGVLRPSNDPRGAYTPKPGYVSVGTLARAIDELPGRGVTTPIDGVFSALFAETTKASDPTRTSVLWSQQERSVELKATKPVTVTTTMGTTYTLEPVKQRITLDLGPSPLIVKGNAEIQPDETSPVSFTVDPAPIGSETTGHFELDNTAGKSNTKVTIVVDERYVLSAKKGKVGSIDVTLPGASASGDRVYTAFIERGDDDRLTGILTARSEVVIPGAVEAVHVVNAAGEDLLRITASNRLAEPLEVEKLSWTIGGVTGEDLVGGSIDAKSTHVVEIPIEDVAASTDYAVSLLTADWGEYRHQAMLEAYTDPLEVPRGTIDVDGVVDADTATRPGIDIVATGTNEVAGWGGASDLSGTFWWTADDDFVYLTADIVDDEHVQTDTGGGIWDGDSVQFAVTPGAPGEAASWSEIGIAKAPNNNVLHRWSAAEADFTLPGAEVEITRDEDTGHTIYEVAIPWERLAPASADGRLISISALVNDRDNDGDGRGWIRWGGGIAHTKDSSQFYPALVEPVAP